MNHLLQAQRAIEVEPGFSLNVLEAGQGKPTLVLLHGLGSAWTAWVFTIALLLPHRHVLAIDLPGHGDSDLLPRFPTVAAQAHAVLALLDRLGIGAAEVAGASMGGVVASEMAVQAPQRVQRLTLLAPPTPMLRSEDLGRLFGWLGDDGLPRFETVEDLAQITPQASPELLVLANVAMQKARGYLPALAGLIKYPFEERTSQLGCPTHLLWGEDDRIVSVERAGWWLQQVAGATLQRVPGAGHNPAFDAPERTAACLLRP